MLEDALSRVFMRFKMEFYRSLFSLVKEREGSLTAMEAFSVDVIHGLGRPTISEFADFLGISQSNATYKVNCLMKKGYIVRENSEDDRREYHLALSEKYYGYTGYMDEYLAGLSQRLAQRLTPEELSQLGALLHTAVEDPAPSAADK